MNVMNMKIRRARDDEQKAIEHLTREAFWNVYKPGCDEHLIIHRLFGDSSFIKQLNYVVELDGMIIGHIAYARGYIQGIDSFHHEAILFGPVSVLPQYQGKGYGSTLINFTLLEAKRLGYKSVFITGDHKYYGRFGFISASTYGVHLEGVDANDPAPYFMVKLLVDEPPLKGIFHQPKCYETSKEDVERFDRSFPEKKKEKRPGQLWE